MTTSKFEILEYSIIEYQDTRNIKLFSVNRKSTGFKPYSIKYKCLFHIKFQLSVKTFKILRWSLITPEFILGDS